MSNGPVVLWIRKWIGTPITIGILGIGVLGAIGLAADVAGTAMSVFRDPIFWAAVVAVFIIAAMIPALRWVWKVVRKLFRVINRWADTP